MEWQYIILYRDRTHAVADWFGDANWSRDMYAVINTMNNTITYDGDAWEQIDNTY